MNKPKRGNSLLSELWGILILCISVLLFTILLLSHRGADERLGILGYWFNYLITSLFGYYPSYLIPFGLFAISIILIRKTKLYSLRRNIIAYLIFLVSLCGWLHLFMVPLAVGGEWLAIPVTELKEYGGLIGMGLSWLLSRGFGKIGAFILLATASVASLITTFNLELLPILRGIYKIIGQIVGRIKRRKVIKTKRAKVIEHHRVADKQIQGPSQAGEPNLGAYDAKIFQLPPTNLLSTTNEPVAAEPIKYKTAPAEGIKIIEDTLQNFGVEAKVVEIARGPAVTRYEIRLAPGITVKRVTRLADDLAMALAAINVRVEAPVPGKSVLGIEVPNPEIEIVDLQTILSTDEFNSNPSKLCFGLGKDTSGKPVIADLGKMPHLLIGGATGTGKTVCINTILASLLTRNTPTELKLLLIDPKRIELTLYDGIPHLAAPVATDVAAAAKLLRGAVSEMERRYDLFATSGARNIYEYNRQLTDAPLPFWVIIIDELADLMLQAPSEFEFYILRLAQLARATGIHLVIATQRPSVDIIPGTIRANMPSRIAFACITAVDSRIILGINGAERLLGSGDMLFFPMDAAKPMRIQGAFASVALLNRIIEYWRQQGLPEYQEILLTAGEVSEESMEEELVDKYFADAARLIIQTGYGSTSMLQRKFKIGYNRAGRLMDMLQRYGVVSPPDPQNPSKPRKVLIELQQLEELLAKL